MVDKQIANLKHAKKICLFFPRFLPCLRQNWGSFQMQAPHTSCQGSLDFLVDKILLFLNVDKILSLSAFLILHVCFLFRRVCWPHWSQVRWGRNACLWSCNSFCAFIGITSIAYIFSIPHCRDNSATNRLCQSMQ